MQFSPYDSIPDQNGHDFKFTFSQIQTDMRDAAFYINRKTGPIKYRDSVGPYLRGIAWPDADA
jgi:hypothetical protein